MPTPRRKGYLLIDNLFSPGVTPADLPAGAEKTTVFVGPDQKQEFDTITCLHCNQAYIINRQRVRSRGYCAKCDGYVCDKPSCGLECKPFAKLLDTLLEQASKNDGRDLPKGL